MCVLLVAFLSCFRNVCLEASLLTMSEGQIMLTAFEAEEMPDYLMGLGGRCSGECCERSTSRWDHMPRQLSAV